MVAHFGPKCWLSLDQNGWLSLVQNNHLGIRTSNFNAFQIFEITNFGKEYLKHILEE